MDHTEMPRIAKDMIRFDPVLMIEKEDITSLLKCLDVILESVG